MLKEIIPEMLKVMTVISFMVLPYFSFAQNSVLTEERYDSFMNFFLKESQYKGTLIHKRKWDYFKWNKESDLQLEQLCHAVESLTDHKDYMISRSERESILNQLKRGGKRWSKKYMRMNAENLIHDEPALIISEPVFIRNSTRAIIWVQTQSSYSRITFDFDDGWQLYCIGLGSTFN